MGGSNALEYLRARPAVHRTALSLAAVALAVGLSIGLTAINEDAQRLRNDGIAEVVGVGRRWAARIEARMAEGISLATAVASFASGNITRAPPHNRTVAERLQIISPQQWDVLAPSLYNSVPGMLSLQLQPSGIIAQMWPPGSAPFGLDAFNLPHVRDGYLTLLASGQSIVEGPLVLAQGGLGVLARTPVYINRNHSYDTWWGAGVAVFRLVELFTALNLPTDLPASGYKFVVYSVDLTNTSTAPTVVMASAGFTCGNNLTSSAGDAVHTRINTRSGLQAMYLCVAKTEGLPDDRASPSAVARVVVPVVAGSIGIIFFVYALVMGGWVWRHWHAPPGSEHDAHSMVIVLVSVKSMGWWLENQSPEQLQADVLSFEREVEAIASEFSCHSSGRLIDGCVLVVGQSCNKAKAFGIAAQERLTRAFANLAVRPKEETSETKMKTDDDTPQRPDRGEFSHPHGASAPTAPPSERLTKRRESSKAGNCGRPLSHASFDIAVTLHFGGLRKTYSPEADRFTFFGASVAPAAAAVDATLAGEVTATPQFAQASHWTTVSRDAPTRSLDDGEQIYLVLSEMSSATTERDRDPMDTSRAESFGAPATVAPPKEKEKGTSGGRRRRSERGNRDAAGDASVAAAISGRTGAAVRRRVAFLSLELSPAEGSAAFGRLVPLPNFVQVLQRIGAETDRAKGVITGMFDTRVVIAFNAVTPVSSPVFRAASADAAIRSALKDADVTIVSVITLGFASVSMVGAQVLCTGNAAYRTSALLEEVTRVNAMQRNSLERCAVVDAATADELRSGYELQCVMPCYGAFDDPRAAVARSRGLKPSLAYLLERPWPGARAAGAGKDDWLFRQQRLESMSAFTPLNVAMEAAFGGTLQPDEASELFHRPDAAIWHPLAMSSLRRLVGLPTDNTSASSSRHRRYTHPASVESPALLIDSQGDVPAELPVLPDDVSSSAREPPKRVD